MLFPTLSLDSIESIEHCSQSGLFPGSVYSCSAGLRWSDPGELAALELLNPCHV